MTMDLKKWLERHSIDVKQEEEELVFTHVGGETSILVPREGRIDDVIEPQSCMLKSVYAHYLGASIGHSDIIIGSVARGGTRVSHGYKIPDLEQMHWQCSELGMNIRDTQEVFMVEAAWMLFYSVERTNDGERLLRYDRDFQSEVLITDVEAVLDRWWEIVLNDLPEEEHGASNADQHTATEPDDQDDDDDRNDYDDRNLTFDF